MVAADTGTTTIEITPTGNTMGGWVAGTTYTVTLTQGQVYNVMGQMISTPFQCNPVCTGYDLTGSLIRSVNTGSGCKKIAVFSGSGRISITCNNNNSSSDNYMVQAMPKTAWGKKYLTTPANGNQANNIFRVCVSNPATIVRINGVVTTLPLQNGFYYEIPATNQPQLIEGDSAIMVAQYFTSQNSCGNGAPGDPEVIYLSAVEQNINKVLWNATPNWAISSHNFNVVLPNSGTAVSSFTLDGAPLGGFLPHPQDPNYVYLLQNVAPGFHIIQSDSGFNAIAYGFGGFESYGYNAGTNIKDLYQQIGVATQYGIESTPSVCTNSPFKFKVSLPYIPDSMHWNFNGAVGMLPNNNTVYIDNTGNVAEDSTTVINGRTIHWYSIPTLYTFTTVGVYPITITVFVPNNDCGSVQDIDFDLGVSDPPVVSFNAVTPGCYLEPVTATETTPQIPKATYKIWWEFLTLSQTQLLFMLRYLQIITGLFPTLSPHRELKEYAMPVLLHPVA
ncbi:MAG: IgGFc-binding protein [Chitinophagaceae bacterium]|nr:IgGFc-binding protein [Chitinophagaceae bacterium]